MTSGDNVELGRFAVAADAALVDAFCQATGRDDDGTVPFTFPMRWLTLPNIRGAALGLLSEAEVVPVHESQSFDYRTPIVIGRSYCLSLAGRRDSDPDRLVLEASVADEAGDIIVAMETVLRLISMQTGAA